MSEVTNLLEAANRGDKQAAAQLLPLVYDELRKLAAAKMAHEKPGQTLDATALVHEAYFNLTGYGDSLNKLQRFAEAKPVLEAALTIRKENERLRAIGYSAQSILGETLIGLKENKDAESHLLDAYKGQLERYTRDDEWRSPEFLQRTLERLVRLYEALGNAPEAAKWRSEMDKWDRVAPPPREVRVKP